VRRLCYPGSGQRSWGCVVRAEELELASIRRGWDGGRACGSWETDRQLVQGKSKGKAEVKAEAEAGLLLCADTRNQDATLLCTYMCTHGGRDLQVAWTCGLVAERYQSAPVVRGLCAVGVPPFQKQRRALASLLTPEQLHACTPRHTTIANSHSTTTIAHATRWLRMLVRPPSASVLSYFATV
jgi:hypothetical protein